MATKSLFWSTPRLHNIMQPRIAHFLYVPIRLLPTFLVMVGIGDSLVCSRNTQRSIVFTKSRLPHYVLHSSYLRSRPYLKGPVVTNLGAFSLWFYYTVYAILSQRPHDIHRQLYIVGPSFHLPPIVAFSRQTPLHYFTLFLSSH